MVLRRASYVTGRNFLAEDNDVNYTNIRHHRRKEGSSSRPRKPTSDRYCGCWVCKSQNHFAADAHTPDEIAKARQQGASPAAYAASVKPKICVRVLLAEYATTSDSSDDSDKDEGDDDAEDDAEAFVAHVDMNMLEQIGNDGKEQKGGNVLDTVRVLFNVAERTGKRVDIKTLRKVISPRYRGAVLDTGCTGSSVISANEYERYCHATGVIPNVNGNPGVVTFGNDGKIKSQGVATIRILTPLTRSSTSPLTCWKGTTHRSFCR